MNKAAVNAIVDAILGGRYQEASALLADSDDALPLAARLELAAHIEFHTARLRPQAALSRCERWLWAALVGSSIGASLVSAAFAAAAGLLVAFGLSGWFARRLTMSWLGDIIHYRYTNFARGLWQSLWLYRLLGGKEALQRAYLRGLAGHFWGMCGHFDRSIRDLAAARRVLAAAVDVDPSDSRAYQYYCEILAIEALHKGYAGLHVEAKESFDLLFGGLSSRPYWWIEVFARSMRLYVAMETVDEAPLREDALRLKRMLGTVFENKYALRTTAYAALIAAIKGNRSLALSQLLESERFYDSTKMPIERSRYHFIRALAELEFGEYELAVTDARIAVVNLSFVPGARFHAAEAELLDIEVRLRLALAPVRAGDPVNVSMLARRLRAIPRMVRGAPAVTERVAGLELLLSLAQGRALEVSQMLPRLAGRLETYAARLALVVQRAIGNGTGESLHRLPQLDALKEEFGLTDLMIKVLASDRSDRDMEELVRAVFGAASCKMTAHDRLGGGISMIGRFEVAHDDAQKLVVRLPAGRREIEFTVVDPLRSLLFDERVRRNLELAAAIIQSIHLNEALAVSEKTAGVGMATQMLAHDVRKPFSLLKTTIARMRAAPTLAASYEALACGEAAVGNALAQAESMIQDVMDLGSRSTARLKDASLVQAISQALAEIPELEGASAPSVDCTFTHRTLARMDKARILRVLHNLLQNAVQATGAKGRLWIRTSETEADLQVTVGNTGSPIASEDLNRIFDAFFTKGKTGGTGLGLTIARQVVEDHGGKIWCTSDASRGTEFQLTLPKGSGHELHQAVASEDSAQSLSLPMVGRVVVLDDDPFILDAWTETLGGQGILTYDDPELFLRAVADGRVHPRELACIITDYHFSNDVLDKHLDRLVALEVPLLLSSDAVAPRELSQFHGVIDKVPLGREALAKLFTIGATLLS